MQSIENSLVVNQFKVLIFIEFLENIHLLEICIIYLSEIILNSIKNESMEKLITKISVHICVGIVLKGISELMFQYLGMHGGSNGRLCSTEIESGVPSIQYLQ